MVYRDPLAYRNPFATNGGVYLGHVANTTEGPPPRISGPPLQLVTSAHCTVIGATGGGKSRSFLLQQLASLTDWSIVVLDPKGEFHRGTHEHRLAVGNKINVIDPFGASLLNPIRPIKKDDDLTDEIGNIANSTIEISNHGDPHWSESSRDLWSWVLAYSRLKGEDGGSLVDARRMLGQPIAKFATIAREAVKTFLREGWPEFAIKASRYTDIKLDSKELLSIISHALSATSWIDSRPVARSLSHVEKDDDGNVINDGSINFEDMKYTPTTTYVILPGNRIYSHGPYLKLVVSCILQALLKSTEFKVPTLLILDEANLVGGLEILERSMTLLRGYGVKIMSVYQDFATAKLALKDRFDSYLANSGMIVSFRTNDFYTASELAKRTGQTTAQIMTLSGGASKGIFGGQEKASINIGPQQIPGMLPQDIMNMDAKYALAWTDQHKGTLRLYLPDVSEMPALRDIARKMG